MFRAEVEERNGFHNVIILPAFSTAQEAYSVAAQINAGADVEAKVQEAVRAERERVVKWLRDHGAFDCAGAIERGDHESEGKG